MNREDHGGEAGPWWKTSAVAYAIAFRVVILSIRASSGLILFWLLADIASNRRVTVLAVMEVVRDCFVGCSFSGLLLGLIFGLPLGVVHVLSARASRMDQEQQLIQDGRGTGAWRKKQR